MALYYINGTSNSGSTFGQTGFFYPLYLTEAEANTADTLSGGTGTSHTHVFTNTPRITFYMPTTGAYHAQASAPTGSLHGEYYISYTSPIAQIDTQEIGTGVLSGDTFDTWRKKTNDVGREIIANKAITNALNSDFNSLITTTGGEQNIALKSGNQIIAGDNTFSHVVRFPAADDSTHALRIGDTGTLHQTTGSGFIFNDTLDNSAASGAVKTNNMEVTSGITTYNSVQYTWPSGAPTSGQILKAGANNTLTWQNEAAAATQLDTFVVEQLDEIGSIHPFAGSSLGGDSKYLFCNGDKVSRTTYAELYSVIGDVYKLASDSASDANPVTGGSATHFRLPNLKGRVTVGVGQGVDSNSTTSTFTLGGTTGTNGVVGEYSHDITIAEMPIHGHAIPTRYDDGNNSGWGSQTANDGNRYNDSSDTKGGISLGNPDNGRLEFRGNFVTGLAGGNSHTAADRRIDNTTDGVSQTNLYDGRTSAAAPFIGAGLPEEYIGQSKITQGTNTVSGEGTVQESLMNVVQPFLVVNYIIKAKNANIAKLHVSAGAGILLRPGGETSSGSNTAKAFTNSTASNLLDLSVSSSFPNELKIDIDTNDFKFGGTGSNQLQLVSKEFNITNFQLMGTVRNNTNRKSENADYAKGYIDTNSLCRNNQSGVSNADKIYFSEFASPSTGELNYNNVLPLVYGSNVEKTVIRARYNWSETSGLEEMQFVDVVVDFKNNTIYGGTISNYEKHTSAFLPKQTLQSSTTLYEFTDLLNGIDVNMAIEVNGSTKTITKLPWPMIDQSHSYNVQSAMINFENHTRG